MIAEWTEGSGNGGGLVVELKAHFPLENSNLHAEWAVCVKLATQKV
jgi:hypothetical protein